MPRVAVHTRARKNFGDSAERVAAMHLEKNGYRIVARNVRTRYGEIDIVAEDADGVAFVEVKARRTRAHGAPEEALTPRKQLKLVQLADSFIAENEIFADKAWRIDLVAMELDAAGNMVRLELIKNAVQL
jgi:putative endonuclease